MWESRIAKTKVLTGCIYSLSLPLRTTTADHCSRSRKKLGKMVRVQSKNSGLYPEGEEKASEGVGTGVMEQSCISASSLGLLI